MTASVANPSVSVDNGGTLNVIATDDYGDPASDSTVAAAGTGGFITASNVVITNGSGSIPLNDHKFVPGAPASLTIVPAQTTVQAGNADGLTGSVFDQYGNLATNETATDTFTEDRYGNAIGDAVEPVPDLSPVAPKGKHEVIGLHTLKQDKFPLRQIR